MQFNHAKHFWTWFSYNSEILLHLNDLDKQLKCFWLRELATHMRAYTKKLSAVLFYPDDGACTISISASGYPPYFRMAEAMAAKAPVMKNWQVYGLQPPGLYGDHFEKEFADTGITRAGIQCLPPEWKGADKGYVVTCYANIGEYASDRLIDAVDALVCDQLGEKTTGLYLYGLKIYDHADIPHGQMDQLVPLDQLRACFPEPEVSNLSINGLGELRKTK